MSKSSFAERMGLSKGRISQLITIGLPVRPDGRIDPADAVPWIEANLDKARRKDPVAEILAEMTGEQPLDGTGTITLNQIRIARETQRLRSDQLEYARRSGGLVDRAEMQRAIFARAAQDRDLLTRWGQRAGPVIASELGADPVAAASLIDRLVHELLAELAATPLEILPDDGDRDLG